MFYFIPYGELRKNLEPMRRFGQGMCAIEAIAVHVFYVDFGLVVAG
jgi:hypothetical protein